MLNTGVAYTALFLALDGLDPRPVRFAAYGLVGAGVLSDVLIALGRTAWSQSLGRRVRGVGHETQS